MKRSLGVLSEQCNPAIHVIQCIVIELVGLRSTGVLVQCPQTVEKILSEQKISGFEGSLPIGFSTKQQLAIALGQLLSTKQQLAMAFGQWLSMKQQLAMALSRLA